jgi:transcriptional regulator with XRE-family HTH domain
MEINERIRALREHRELSQQQLGIKAGLSKNTIKKFESPNPGDIQRSSLIKLATALEIDGDYFLATDKNRTIEYYFKRTLGFPLAVALSAIPDEAERKTLQKVVDSFGAMAKLDAYNAEKNK